METDLLAITSSLFQHPAGHSPVCSVFRAHHHYSQAQCLWQCQRIFTESLLCARYVQSAADTVVISKTERLPSVYVLQSGWKARKPRWPQAWISKPGKTSMGIWQSAQQLTKLEWSGKASSPFNALNNESWNLSDDMNKPREALRGRVS